MYCNKCGEKLSEDSFFCSFCGFRQIDDEQDATEWESDGTQYRRRNTASELQPDRYSARQSDRQPGRQAPGSPEIHVRQYEPAANFDIYRYEPLWNFWRVRDLIGSGTYGKVYLACREEYGQTYYSAVKHISIPQDNMQLSDLLAEGLADDEASAQDYYREVLNNILKEVKTNYELKGQPNIVLYEDHAVMERPNTNGFDVFIKMELLTSLNDVIKQKTLTQQEVAKLGIDICTALEIMSRKKILHRDIKPANIFVTSDGDYKLGDFGIARHMEKTISSMSVKGTFAYMPPEIQKGEKADHRVDIYSLGLVLYRLLNANRAPFLPLPPAKIGYADNNKSMERRMKGEPLPPPAYADEELSKIVLKACSYKAEDRWSDAAQLKKALKNYWQSVEEQLAGRQTTNMQASNASGTNNQSGSNQASDARQISAQQSSNQASNTQVSNAGETNDQASSSRYKMPEAPDSKHESAVAEPENASINSAADVSFKDSVTLLDPRRHKTLEHTLGIGQAAELFESAALEQAATAESDLSGITDIEKEAVVGSGSQGIDVIEQETATEPDFPGSTMLEQAAVPAPDLSEMADIEQEATIGPDISGKAMQEQAAAAESELSGAAAIKQEATVGSDTPEITAVEQAETAAEQDGTINMFTAANKNKARRLAQEPYMPDKQNQQSHQSQQEALNKSERQNQKNWLEETIGIFNQSISYIRSGNKRINKGRLIEKEIDLTKSLDGLYQQMENAKRMEELKAFLKIENSDNTTPH